MELKKGKERRRIDGKRKLKKGKKENWKGREEKLEGESKREVKETRQLELERLMERNKMGNIRG